MRQLLAATRITSSKASSSHGQSKSMPFSPLAHKQNSGPDCGSKRLPTYLLLQIKEVCSMEVKPFERVKEEKSTFN